MALWCYVFKMTVCRLQKPSFVAHPSSRDWLGYSMMKANVVNDVRISAVSIPRLLRQNRISLFMSTGQIELAFTRFPVNLKMAGAVNMFAGFSENISFFKLLHVEIS